MKNLMKKLSVVLTLAMVLTLVPMRANVAKAEDNTVTVDMTKLSPTPTATNDGKTLTATSGNITVVGEQNEASNPPAYGSDGTFRIYAKGTFTVSVASGSITKIVVTLNNGSKGIAEPTVNTGAYDKDTLTWTGSAASVVFTLGASGQWRVASIAVTVEGASTTPTDTPATTPTDSPAPTATDTPAPTPTPMTEAEVLAAVATLEAGKSLDGTQTLTGVITKVVTAYSSDYKNITVDMKVQDTVIEAYRLKEGSELKVGDKIKVTGTITNYKGTIEFASGCTYEMVEAAAATPTPEATATPTPTTAPMTESEVLAASAKLAEGENLEGQSLTGVITKITTAYSTEYKNITLVMKVGDTEITAYRLADGKDLAVGDKITVTGTITNYKGTVEFVAKSTYVVVTKAPATGVTTELPVVGMVAIVALCGAAAALYFGKRKNVQ